MTENMKKFLEAVSKDEALKSELEAIVKGDVQKNAKAFLEFAAKNGFTFTAEDFKPADDGELSQDELKAVAGGYDWEKDPSCLAYPNRGQCAVVQATKDMCLPLYN